MENEELKTKNERGQKMENERQEGGAGDKLRIKN
jgi:hypothetical protein